MVFLYAESGYTRGVMTRSQYITIRSVKVSEFRQCSGEVSFPDGSPGGQTGSCGGCGYLHSLACAGLCGSERGK